MPSAARRALPLAAGLLLLAGCAAGADDAPASTAPATATGPAPVQEKEIASVQGPGGEAWLTLGRALEGGRYSLAVRCTGPQLRARAPWRTDRPDSHGALDVTCAPGGGTVQTPVDLPAYVRRVELDTSGLAGRTVDLSVAPVT